MEILIIGGVVVALMVYASTRIKRSAAAAFELENIDNATFTLQKPEGFLNVINVEPDLAFRAYSRDFGTGESASERLATATVRCYSRLDADAVATDLTAGESIISDIREKVGEHHFRIIESAAVEKEGDRKRFRKIAPSGRGTFVLDIEALGEADGVMLSKIDQMLSSFELK